MSHVPMIFRLILACLFLLPVAQAANVPTGFSETLVAGGTDSGLNPTRIAFAPDGRLFLLEKPGRVRAVVPGMTPALQAGALLDISARVDVNGERGLLGLAFDPDFSTTANRHLYLYYTVKTPLHNRVSRFTIDAAGAILPAETILLDLPTLSSPNHNGGALAFGSDKKLYITVGENAVGANAQNLDTLLGKLLRINTDGSFPADNPYYTTATAARSAVWCLGLRNPFSLAARAGEMFVNDVGAGTTEEVNRVVKGVNFGWPGIEGRRTTQVAPANYQDPIHVYGRYAICGAAFYNPATPGASAFPSVWTGRYFFADYVSGWIKAIDPAAPATAIPFLTGVAKPIDITIAPDGTMWYLGRGTPTTANPIDNTQTKHGVLYQVRSTAVLPATRLAFTQQPLSTAAGSTMAAIKVSVQNAGGGLVGDATHAVTLALSSGTLLGTTTVSAVAGIATFANLHIDAPATGLTLTATASGLSAATSSAFSILGQASPPVAKPGTGSFSGPVWVQLTSATPGATIRYTTDGSAPTASSPIYTAPFELTATTTVKSMALKSGMTSSSVTSTTCTITGATPYGLAYRPVVNGLNLPASPLSVPTTLSATGVFTDLAALTPRPGIIPFTVNSPLWSDNAEKQRWVALPGNATVGFSATGEWIWPAGTVLIKHFAIKTDERTPAVLRRLETRILVVNPAGGSTYGVTYRWRTSGTTPEADLVAVDGQDETLTITGPTGSTRSQTWRYPSQEQCMSCHNTGAGEVLGPKTRQLNGTYAFPGGASDNQLRTWNYLRMFSSDIGEAGIPALRRMVAVNDANAPLETRVRSYLDANCASCHRPGANVPWDARFDTPISQQGIINGAIVHHLSSDPQAIPRERVVVPRDLPVSVLHERMASTSASVQMPPLGRNVVHEEAMGVIRSWIGQLPNGSGLRGDYWTNQAGTFNGPPTVSRIDPQVSFAWGAAAPAAGLTTDRFSVRWTGTIVPAFTETYTFTTVTDDGVRLWIDDQLVIDHFVNQVATSWSGSIALTAGQAVPIRMEYYDSTSSASASLRWQSPSLPVEVVPMYRLFPATGTQVATSIAVTPGLAEAILGGTMTFSAVVRDQNGAPMDPQPAITWSGNAPAGIFTATTVGGPYTVTATAAGKTGTATVSVVPAFALKVNFQPLASPTVAGYWPDGGLVFGDRGNGFSYGWNVDITATARDRNLNANQLLDTLLHMQKAATPTAQWEVQVDNGSYQVFAVAGDSGNYPNSTATPRNYRIAAEGALLVSGVPTTATRYFQTPDGGLRVEVRDGRLTVSSAAGAIDNKLMYIEIIRVPSAAN